MSFEVSTVGTVRVAVRKERSRRKAPSSTETAWTHFAENHSGLTASVNSECMQEPCPSLEVSTIMAAELPLKQPLTFTTTDSWTSGLNTKACFPQRSSFCSGC